MKAILHSREDRAALSFLIGGLAIFIIYLAVIAYAVLEYMHNSTLTFRHGVIIGIGYKLHKKVVPFFRNQVFVRR